MGGHFLYDFQGQRLQGPALALVGMTSTRPAGRRSRAGNDNPARLLEVRTSGLVPQGAKNTGKQNKEVLSFVCFGKAFAS